MNSIQKSDKQDYYDICRMFLSVTGQWLYQRPRERILRMGFIVTYNISMLAVQIAQFYLCETTPCILRTLPMHLAVWLSIVKVLTYYFNNQKIKQLIELLHADWNILETQEECKIMRRYALNGRWYSLIYASYLYVCAFTFGATMLLPRIFDAVFPLNQSRPVKMICPSYYFIDENKYFYYIFFHYEIGSLISITGVIAYDCAFFTYVEHVCGLFTIVGFRFENLVYKRNITNKCPIDSPNDAYVANIAFAIQIHQRALEFIVLLENIFYLSFAIQILIIMIIMSSSLTQIFIGLQGDVTELIKYLTFVVGQLFYLLLYSFQGQELINHSLEAHIKIYNGPWYNIPVKSQKLLLFAMRKSTEVISLSAGKIYIFSLENFTLIVKTSVSYFTVLSTFSEP